MNILVTGGKGQLGCSLQKISTIYTQHHFVFTDMPEADITDRHCMERLVEEHSINLIINCAAYTAVDRAESDIELAERINVHGPCILAQVARERSVQLIHISTDYVFDGNSCHPIHEEQPTDPIGVYGRTKRAGEEAIEREGGDAAIIRTAWLYSEFGNNFVKTMLRLGNERDALNVVYDQIGTPTYAPDLAHAILCVAEHGIRGVEYYHYSNEGVISWYDFAQEIFALAQVSVSVTAIESYLYPVPAKRPAYSVLAKDKIKAIGASVPYWKESLKACLLALKGEQ